MFRNDGKIKFLERNFRVGHREMQRARDRAVTERKDHFQQPGNPRGRFEVADIALDRADSAAIAGRTRSAEHRPQGTAFDRVADARAGAMRLDVGDLARVDPGITVHSAQQRFLRRLVGHRQACGTAIRIHARADDDGIDRVLLGDRLRERAQNDDRAAFRPDITVAGRVEGAASAGRRQHARLREADGTGRRQQRMDTGRNRQARLTRPQADAGFVHRNQR